MSGTELPIKGQVVKTKVGDKTWRVLRVLDKEIYLEGVTNFKFKRLTIDQSTKQTQLIKIRRTRL